MKVICNLLVVIALLFLQPVSSVFANAGTTTNNEKFTWDTIIWNECTGEEIQLTGTILYMSASVTTDAGTLQWNFLDRYQFTAVGLSSGIKYQGVGVYKGFGTTVANPELPYHYVVGAVQKVKLIGQGDAPDFHLSLSHHLTITPTYQETAIEELHSICE